MRLRLSIRRNGLPETFIIWSIDISSQPTIYQLLEQVNEVVPIESDDDWGLEDYAVELRGFNDVNYEFLHFQNVASVLKEDDEVIIRCLFSNDIKKRRVSGRTQLTSDGRRLFDGVPWGKPLLRKVTARPPVKIHPKYPKRLTYTQNQDELENSENSEACNQEDDFASEKYSNQQLVLQSGLDTEDSECDEDYVPDEESNGEGSDWEYSETNSVAEEIATANSDKVSEVKKVNHDSTKTLDRHAQICLLHSAFPSSNLAVCKYVIDGTKGNISEAWEALSIGFPASKSREEITKIASVKDNSQINNFHATPKSPTPPKSDQEMRSTKSKKSVTQSLENKRNTPVHEKNNLNDIPSDPVTADRALSLMPDASPNVNGSQCTKNPRSSILTFSKNYTPELIENNQGHDFYSKSSDESSNSSDRGSSCTFSTSSVKKINLNRSSYKIDGNSSDKLSCEDEAPDIISSKSSHVENRDTFINYAPSNAETKPLVAPGLGKKATKRRNERRKISNTIKRLKEKGIIPAGASKDESIILYEKQQSLASNGKDTTVKLDSVNQKSVNKTEEDREFQLRRKELLESIYSGGVEVQISPSSKSLGPKIDKTNISQHISNPQSAIDETGRVFIGHRNNTTKDDVISNTVSEVSKSSVSIPVPETEPVTSRLNQEVDTPQRSTLNIDTGRRILLTSMGFNPSISKQDEENIRKNLTKNPKNIKNSKHIELDTDNVGVDKTDPEAWRGKIIYRAVECVQKGVELAEPPFPFYQRWDHQQQLGKRRKNQGAQAIGYKDHGHFSKRRKIFQDTETVKDPQYFETSNGSSHNENLMEHRLEFDQRNNSFTSLSKLNENKIQWPEDLPPLPYDISHLLDLTESQITTRMIIAFKQLEISPETRWQPQVSAYKTAIVTSIDHGKIQVQLAHRDFHPASEKLYDENGQRIYEGYETIEVDEEDDEETQDNGCRDLHFYELIDPKIVKLDE